MDLDLKGTHLKHELVRFQATCGPCKEPALLSATLLQIGDRYVQKVQPDSRLTLDIVPSAIVRLAVYRDQWPEDWSSLIKKPLRSVLEVCALSQTCDSDAAVFNAFLRVPVALGPLLLGYSGEAGVYFEPRGQEARQNSVDYNVFWMPKASYHDALVFKQTHADVVGLARVGQRFGVRCAKDNTEALHAILRPTTPYMAMEGALTFHAGPWPYGTQRATIVKAFKEWKWEARPMQPIPRPSGSGLWWAVVAREHPPQAILYVQQGEVLISEVKSKATPKVQAQAPVVAAKAAMQALSVVPPAGEDPLQINDPWAAALPAKLPRPVAVPAPLQVASFLVGALWILGAVAYGYPTAPSATSCLLDAITDRIVHRGEGPRFIAGDFNLQPQALQHAREWANHGFIDVQDIWHQRTGCIPKVTCKNATRKDYLFVSAELLPLLQAVEVDPTWFCDHSALLATFQVRGLSVPSPIWRMPRQRKFSPQVVQAMEQGGFQTVPVVGDSAAVYRKIWQEFETRASQALRGCGQAALRPAEVGRGQTSDITMIKAFQGQVAVGRAGEVKPGFFGKDRLYCQWFRQLRRLQALVQALGREATTDNATLYRAGLWHAIQNAPGFKPSFVAWWPKRDVCLPEDPVQLALGLPGPVVARQIFLSFQANVQELEKRLSKQRKVDARQRRVQSPALIFKDLQKAAAQPVQTIVQSVKAKVVEVRHDEAALVLDSAPRWHEGAGFFINGLMSGTLCPSKELLLMFSAFGAEWLQRWMKHEHIEPNRWSAIIDAFPENPVQPYALVSITVPAWRAAIQGKHARSATGLDGVSRGDLLALPTDLTDSVIGLCARAEGSGDWAPQLLDARISALEKVVGAAEVTQFRPICVLPMAYRTWSSIRAKEALRHLSKVAPAILFGNLPGRSAGGVWYGLQMAIEQAQIEGFQIRGATGPALPSATGFPEGCALSCVAMAIVDFALHVFVGSSSSPDVLSTFVDDWQLMGNDGPEVQRALKAVEDFVQSWDLAMDPTKTIHWATHPVQRRELRRGGVQVALSCRNLGGNMAFTRRRSASTISERIQALEGLWPKLSASCAPLKQKINALMLAAWPRALRGISTVTLCDAAVAGLRAGAARGLGLDRPGLNSKVLLSLVCHPLADPQFFAIASTFKDLRAFADPGAFSLLVSQVLKVEGRWTPGPAQAFLERCHSVGLSWDVEQGLLQDGISTFDPWKVAPQELGLRLAFAWQVRVGQELEARPGFQGLSRADPGLTASFRKLASEQQSLVLILAQSGAFFTQDALHHFSTDPLDTATCKYCDFRDSVYHRLWECPGFAECREKHAGWALPDPATTQPALALRGWALRPERQVDLWRALHAIPDGTYDMDWPSSLPDSLDLFTDGSCFLPTLPQIRLASWAVTLAAPVGITPWILCSGPLRGILQTAFRAEITAVIAALRVALVSKRVVRIWSDCAGVVKRLRAAGNGQLVVRRDLALQSSLAKTMALLHQDVAEVAIKGKDLVATAEQPEPGGHPPTWGIEPNPMPRHVLKYGHAYVRSLATWLRDLFTVQAGRPQWISFVQLYFAFFMETGQAPPVYVSRTKSWMPFAETNPVTAAVSMSERARFFRQHVRAIVAAVHGKLFTGEVRPFSASLAIKLPCCYVAISDVWLERVEQFLHEALPNGVCVQRGFVTRIYNHSIPGPTIIVKPGDRYLVVPLLVILSIVNDDEAGDEHSQPVLCPASHYCPEGSSEPLPCPPGHICKGLGLEVFVDAWGDVVPLAAGDLHTVVVSKSGELWAAGDNQLGQLGTGGTVGQHAFVHVAVDGKIKAVAAGGVHTAAITESGELWTWGNSWCGQLGVSPVTSGFHVPVKVSVNGQKIVAVAAGEVHTAAITDSGELWTWGPKKPDDMCPGVASVNGHVPVIVNASDQQIVAVAAGRRHIVAITDSGELWTWGRNGDGQLGVGDTVDRHAPVKVNVDGQKIVAVAAGHLHTAAITDSGELWGWGRNDYGQLGIGDKQDRHAPVKVNVDGQKIVAVAARGRHSAAITEAGDLWTWGRPAECPDVDSTIRYVPVKVSLPNRRKIVAVAMGLRHIAAITHSGELWTWGCNFQGELGVGDTANRHSPVKVALPAKIGEMPVPLCWSPEGLESSALAEAFLASKVPVPRECSSLRGQLAAFQQRRVHVGDLGAWEAAPCPAGSFCPSEEVGAFAASLEDGAVQQCPEGFVCTVSAKASTWKMSRAELQELLQVVGTSRGTEVLGIWRGVMIVSVLAAGSFLFRMRMGVTRPTKSRLVPDFTRRFFDAFGFRQDVTVMEDGFLYLNFVDFAEQMYEFPVTEDPRMGSSRAEEVRAPSESTESSFELAEARDGQPVLCPAGHYCPEGSSEPLPCPSGHICKGQDVGALANGTWGDVVRLAAGARHTVVVSKSGQVWAAGDDDFGEWGTGGTLRQHAFVHVAFDGKKIVAVAAGDHHTAAITDSGELWTWGANEHGQLGVGDTKDRHAPVTVSVNGQKIVAAVLLEDRHVPVKVSVNGQKIVAVAAGHFRSAAITDSGELWAWGLNGNGQLGIGDTKDRHAPVKVSLNGQKIVAVAAGHKHTAAITDSGELWTWSDNGEFEGPEDCGRGCWTLAHRCDHDSGELWTWGCNGGGKLGIGDTTNRYSPVKAALPAKIGEMPVAPCWSLGSGASSAVHEAFLAATWGSTIPMPRQCSALLGQLAAFQQKCHMHLGAWEATPCPAGSFCPREQVGTKGSTAPTPCKAGVWCPAGSTGPPGNEGVQSGGSTEILEQVEETGQIKVPWVAKPFFLVPFVHAILRLFFCCSFGVQQAEQEKALSWFHDNVAYLAHKLRQKIMSMTQQHLQHLEASVHSLEAKVQILTPQNYTKLEEQRAASKQQIDQIRKDLDSHIAKLEQLQCLEAKVQTLTSQDYTRLEDQRKQTASKQQMDQIRSDLNSLQQAAAREDMKSQDFTKLEDQLQQAATKQDMDKLRQELESQIGKLVQQSASEADVSVSLQDLKASVQNVEEKLPVLKSQGFLDTAVDCRGTEALGICCGFTLVSAFCFLFRMCMRGGSQVAQYDHAGRRVLKIHCPNLSIRDVRVRHSGLRVEVDLGQGAMKPRLVQARLRSSRFEAFEFRQDETVMVGGFLFLHFVESVERMYDFAVTEDARMEEVRTPSESTRNSFEFVADAAEEAVDGANE
ncbi:UVR8 [Symbiodinium sp. CCMP2592]|nr:UVR8 [Symbiodinium sp. CCMP2592]